MTRIGRFVVSLFGAALFSLPQIAMAQGDCLNTILYPGGAITPDAGGAETVICTCCFESEYSIITGIVSGATYRFRLESGGYLTIREGTPGGPVVAQGYGIVDVLATSTADLFPHRTISDACDIQSICVVSTVEYFGTCAPPLAFATLVEDCDQQLFFVDVVVQSTGNGATVNVVSDVFGTITSIPGVGVGTYQMGPFFFGEQAIITVEHESDPTCNQDMGTFTETGECPVNIFCGQPATNFTYCYDNNEAKVWNYASLGGGGSLVLSFFSGTIEPSFNDQFTIYDGPDNTGAILFQHNAGVVFDLTALTVASTTGALHLELVTNGFGSCVDAVTSAWNWQVQCLNCVLPQASMTNVDDCVNNQFSVPVDVTDLGDGSSVSITYTVNFGTPITLPGVGLGITTLGPFTINDIVSVFVEHASDPACTVALGVITDSGDCPNLIVCGTPPLEETYCYVPNDARDWSYQAIGSGTLRLTFHMGTIESSFYDSLKIYDGVDATGTLLFEHIGSTTHLGPPGSATDELTYPNYYGLQFYSVSGGFYMEMSSDGSVQCGSAGFDQWEWDVVCLDCTIPVADVTIVDDCANDQFTLDVDITSTGSGTTAALDYTVNGGAPQNLSGLATGVVTLGPFPLGDVIDLTIAHESNSLCNIPLGEFSDTGTCPTLIDCDGTFLNDSVCFANNQDLRYYYQGTGTFPLGIFFDSGDLAFGDSIMIYDGGDITAPVIYADGDGQNMTGAFFFTTNPEHRLCLRIKANGFTDCATGGVTAQTEWQIGCLDCVPPAATFAIVQDCENFQYYVDVTVSDMGTDPDPEITNSAGLASTTVTGVGTFQVGPFTSGTQVELTIENDANSLCNIYSGVLVNPLCPTILCGSTPIVETYCYTNLENRAWAFATPDGSGTLRLHFDIGTIESNVWDDLIIYDGPDASGPVLFTHGDITSNLGPVGSAVNGIGITTYEAVDVTTTSGSIYMTLTTDGSVACNTNGVPNAGYDPWQFQVECIGCAAPGIQYNLVADCLHREYKAEVIVTSSPGPLGLTVTNSVTGETQSASDIGVLYFGPYSVDTLSLFEIVDLETPGCVWLSDSLTYPSDSCIIRSCGIDNYIYCYENDEDRWYTFQSLEPVPTTIAFLQGQLLNGDRITIYNGYNETALPPIYEGSNGGNLTGFAVNSQNPNNVITLRIRTNEAGSCEDGVATTDLRWDVGCGAVGMQEITAGGFMVYPNPSEGSLTIVVGSDVTGPARTRVLDMSGRTVMEVPLNLRAGSTNTIDMRELQNGQYLLQLVTEKWTKVQRVQIAR